MDQSTAHRPERGQPAVGEGRPVPDGDACSYPRRIAKRVALLAIMLGLVVTPIWIGLLAWAVLKGIAWLLQ